MPAPKLLQITKELSTNDWLSLMHDWEGALALPHQRSPEYDHWLIWLFLGGRGSGKTRTGAEWVRAQVMDYGARRVALVAPTYHDAREVMLYGDSGLMNLGYNAERPLYIASRRLLEWPNGAVGQVFTSEEPDGLRGPQFDCAWGDEFCAWRNADDTLSNLRLALRLGAHPQLMITTTPKPVPALFTLLEKPGVYVRNARTQDNAVNLAPGFIAAMDEAYGGTRLGRQELGGDVLRDTPGALWTRDMIERARAPRAPKLEHIIVAIDPPVTSGPNADRCGLIVAGRTGRAATDKAYILHDGTVEGESPEGWARAAATLARQWDAAYILAEVNQGGEMVRTVINAVDPGIVVKSVFASRSKKARAEPVALLYEQGRVGHAGFFPALEDELCRIGAADMMKAARSPDRADALVWAVTDLLLGRRRAPRVQTL